MTHTLLIVGLTCVIAAIVGGGVKLLGNDIPVLTFSRQLWLGAVGLILVSIAGAGDIRAWYEEVRTAGRPTDDPAHSQPTQPPPALAQAPSKPVIVQKDKGTEGRPADQASVGEGSAPRSSAAPNIVTPSLSLGGLNCSVNSYGGLTAEKLRQDIFDSLDRKYGCSTSTSNLSENCNANFHVATRPEGPWRGFSTQNTVLYYSQDNADLARTLADALHREFKVKFFHQRGAGLCVNSDAYKATIIVHVRDDK